MGALRHAYNRKGRACCGRHLHGGNIRRNSDAFLEYVASTGKQYVDTGIRAKSGIRAEIGMMWNSASGWYFTFLGAKNGDDNLLLCHVHATYRWSYFYGTTSANLDDISGIPTRELNKYYDVVSEYTADGRFSATINGVTATATPSKNGTAVGTLDTGLNLYLFARNLKKADGTVTSDLPVNARCYYLKIWTNDVNGVYVLARDLKPCVKGNIPGLYDKVTGEILYSGTATALEAGPEKDDDSLPPGATPLEYVASAGNHHIDTKVVAKTGTRVETGMMWLQSYYNNHAFLVAKENKGPQFMLVHNYYGYWHTNYGKTSASRSNTILDPNIYYAVKAGGTADGKFSLEVNGSATTVGSGYTFADSGYNYWLFAQNASGSQSVPVQARCYYLKMWVTNGVDWVNDTLVRDFKPCKDPSGTVALYDMVDKEYFYPNTGTLAAGPEVALGDVVWTGAAGTFALDDAANWSSGKTPTTANAVAIPVGDSETVFTSSSALAFGDVKLIGAGAATIPVNVSMTSFEIAPYVTAKFAAVPGVTDGGIKGAGTLVLDPGAGNTLTMTKNNTGFTGEAIIKSGVVKFGDRNSFGDGGSASANGTARVRVKAGAKLDTVAGSSSVWSLTGRPSNNVVLEDGAQLVNSVECNADPEAVSPVSPLTIEGDTTIDNGGMRLNFGIRTYTGYDYADFHLGANTLSLSGAGTTTFSASRFSGEGTLDVLAGTTLNLRGGTYYDNRQVFVTNGLLKIRSGANLAVVNGKGGRNTVATVKNLQLDGTGVVDAKQTLAVTGFLTGVGIVNRVTLAEGAVFKPTGTGYLTITESLSGKMAIDASGLDLESSYDRIPLFKVGSAEMLQNIVVEFVEGTKPRGWVLVKTDDGLGYDLVRCGFSIIIR